VGAYAPKEGQMTPPIEMTDDAYRVLVNYTREIADLIGLKSWQFDLSRDPAPYGVIARVEVWGDSETCTIWIGPAFWKYGPKMQRETVVHELIHCHTNPLVKYAKAMGRSELGQQASRAFDAALDINHERTVDGIAAAVARMCPLIDWQSLEPIYHDYEAQPEGEVPDGRDVVVIET
jgi:hypothetical protein